ncbi:DUF7006 family protein [Enterococcus mundtii]|uniref:Uncharacterized protein n=1 Tax=Enterococcus mundtii TaxID=53346 RepID=A0A2S7RVG6_ENTMU|nr:hypothetical protein [Enterococcus mundtii]PQF23835.1 hypothetical protein CUS89_05945 [Enterococcus mundtii]
MIKKVQVTPATYLKNYEELCHLQDFPIIQQVCIELHQKFVVICRTPYDNILEQFAELLEIDAQLQMFLDFLQHGFFEETGLAEEEVVEMILKDKNVYYRLLTGIATNQKAPKGLIYLSEK